MSDKQIIVCSNAAYSSFGPGQGIQWEGGRGAISIVANAPGTDEVDVFYTPDFDPAAQRSGCAVAPFPLDASLNTNHDGETSKLTYFELPAGQLLFVPGTSVTGMSIVIFRL